MTVHGSSNKKREREIIQTTNKQTATKPRSLRIIPFTIV